MNDPYIKIYLETLYTELKTDSSSRQSWFLLGKSDEQQWFQHVPLINIGGTGKQFQFLSWLVPLVVLTGFSRGTTTAKMM
jgi:hypothetical protein